MAQEIKFRIVSVEEVTTKDGRKFNAYKTLDKNGRRMDVRFRRDCKNIPKEPCMIVVDRNSANVDTSRQFPVLWVADIIRCEEIVHASNLDDFFGSDS